MKKTPMILAGVLALAFGVRAESRATETYLDTGWKFARFWNADWPKDEAPREPQGGCAAAAYDTSSWRGVRLPHDWGVEKPFTMDIAGMLGHLAFYGIGWYKTDFDLSPDETARLAKGGRLYLDFDGAMSFSTVYVNGKDLGTRPFGFISFRVDATEALVSGARQHLAVRLENRLGSGRWYHGGGLYRRVRRVVVPKVHIDHWGVTVRSQVKGCDAEVTAAVAVTGGVGQVTGVIYDGTRAVAELKDGRAVIPNVHLWDIDDPHLYTLELKVAANGETDTCRQTFGVRTVEFRPREGLFLNGRHIKFQGVCQHSDCGALGTAASARVFERQVQILKEMGCNAIRTTHNPASPDLLEACDKYGVMVMDEPFDMWAMPKGGPNAYGNYFNAWWKKDLTDFIRRDRNHPSVVMWSIGNEVREQWKPELGLPIATNLVATYHTEDPTRPVTIGNDWQGTWTNGYVQVVDVFGANYKADLYGDFYRMHPDKGLVGTETESLLSTRDAYYFPEDDDWASLARPNYRGFYDWQASSYEKYTIRPINTAAEIEFKAQRKYPQCYGAFVWTGFDYIGEPSPYEGKFQPYHRASSPEKAAEMQRFREQYGTNATPPRSSYYGIFDLCGFPKDRYWCYKAEWRPDVPVAHILPHWTWPGREGKVTPVYVYANGDFAELFVNGKSMGRRWADESLRLMWLDVRYQPGTVKVVVWKDGKIWARAERRTAGLAKTLEITSDTATLNTLQDLAYVKLALKDADGTVVPESDVDLTFAAEGAIEVAGLCNGDPADLTGFQAGHQKTFHGLCQAVVRAREGVTGRGSLTVTGGGLSAKIDFDVPPPARAAKRLFVMRFDDNHATKQWRQVADAFERHGLRASFAVTPARFSDEQGECLAELSRRGHEIMDHTPQHAIYRQNFSDDASFAARTNRPYVAAWDAASRSVFCNAEIDWQHKSVFRFKGAIRDGEVVVTDPAALKRLHFSAKFYVPSAKRWFGVRRLEGDRRFIADFWGRDVKDVVLPETEMVTLFQDGIQPSDELLRDQCLTTRRIFDRYSIARPTCWIQPGGWESFLGEKALERVCGRAFGYVAGDAVVGGPLSSSPWVLRPDFAYLDEGKSLEDVKKRVTDTLAKRPFFIYISHMNGSRAGGWDKWLADTEAFAAWLAASDISVVTYSDLARRLFAKDK